jgi:hypothetical protein
MIYNNLLYVLYTLLSKKNALISDQDVEKILQAQNEQVFEKKKRGFVLFNLR